MALSRTAVENCDIFSDYLDIPEGRPSGVSESPSSAPAPAPAPTPALEVEDRPYTEEDAAEAIQQLLLGKYCRFTSKGADVKESDNYFLFPLRAEDLVRLLYRHSHRSLPLHNILY